MPSNNIQETIKEINFDSTHNVGFAPKPVKAAAGTTAPKKPKSAPKSEKVVTWSDSSYSSFKLRNYLLQKYCRENSSELIVLTSENPYSIYLGPRNAEANRGMANGVCVMSFIFNEHLFIYTCSERGWSAHLSTKEGDIEELESLLNNYVKYHNPYRGKYIRYEGNDDDDMEIKASPGVSFDEVILPDNIKTDIYDNTVFHLKEMEYSNGIILYGEPGTGKTLICSAIASEAVEAGFSVVTVTMAPNFYFLENFINSYLGKTVVIFEDIDSFAFNREDHGINPVLPEFLQFMNGVSDREEHIIAIATTNFVDLLDQAVGNRPVRFNRKFGFTYPNDELVAKLVGKYIGKEADPTICYGKKFTGAHISEIRRTAEMYAKKRNTNILQEYPAAVECIRGNFSIKFSEAIGFAPDK